MAAPTPHQTHPTCTSCGQPWPCTSGTPPAETGTKEQ